MASRYVLTRLEAAFTALLFAWVLGAGLLAVVVAPRIRGAVEASGHHLPRHSQWILSAGWWPGWLAVLILCTAAAALAHAPRARRGALAGGLLLGLLAFALYGRVVYAELDLQTLFEEGNPLERKSHAEPPPQLQP